MKSAGALFAFSGIDCAGKSTQITRATGSLRTRGFRSTVFWLRPGYSRELDALRRAVRWLRPGAIPYPGSSGGTDRARTFARKDVRFAWVAMALADLTAQYAVKLRMLRANHDVVLCDRYLIDAQVDFALRFPELTAFWSPAMAALTATAPRPDAHFLLVLPYDEMLRRAAAKAEPFPDSDSIRDARFRAYVSLAAAPAEPLRVIDSNRAVDDVAFTIVETITSCLERRRGRP